MLLALVLQPDKSIIDRAQALYSSELECLSLSLVAHPLRFTLVNNLIFLLQFPAEGGRDESEKKTTGKKEDRVRSRGRSSLPVPPFSSTVLSQTSPLNQEP